MNSTGSDFYDGSASTFDYEITVSIEEFVKMLNAVGEAGLNDPSGNVSSALAPSLRSLLRLAVACIGPVGALAGPVNPGAAG